MFASVSQHVEDRVTLYENGVGISDFKVTQELSFDAEMKVSADSNTIVLRGDPSDLESGDVICPGNVIIEMDGSGDWADGYFRAEQGVVAKYEGCIASSSWSGDPNYGLPITWSWNNYNTISDEDMCESDESCWGREGSFKNQKVKKFHVFQKDNVYSDKEGRISTLCQGALSTTVTRSGNQIYFYSSSVEHPPQWEDVYLTAPHGDSYFYSITGNMDVSGCAVTIRPGGDCSGVTHGFINSQTNYEDRNSHYTNSIGLSEISLEVTEDPYFNFDFPGVDLQGGCLDLLPGESTEFSFVFINSAESIMDMVIEEIEVRGFIGLDGNGAPIYDDTIEFTYDTNAIGLVLPPGVSTEVTGTLSASDGTLPAEVEYLQFIVHYRSYTEGCDGEFLRSWFPFNVRLCEVEHGPDLDPEIWINDRHVEIGQKLPIHWRVTNIGEDPSPETGITFYDIDGSIFYGPITLEELEASESTLDPESFLIFECTEDTKGLHQITINVYPVDGELNPQNLDSTETFFCGSPTCSIEPENVEITKRGEARLSLSCSTGDGDLCRRTELILLPFPHYEVTYFEVEWEPISGPPVYVDPVDYWRSTIVHGHEDAEKGDTVTVRATVFDPALEEFVDTREEATAICEAVVNITDIPCEDYI